jgi:hypothetical protein
MRRNRPVETIEIEVTQTREKEKNCDGDYDLFPGERHRIFKIIRNKNTVKKRLLSDRGLAIRSANLQL